MSTLIKVKTVAELHNVMGLEKPKHPLISLQQHSNLDFSVIPKDVKVSIDLYHIMLKQGINGGMLYGRNSYDFEEGTMLFVAPGQVIQHVDTDFEVQPKGWSLVFHPDLIRSAELGKVIDSYSFFSYEVNEALHLSEEERTIIKTLTNTIEKEYSGNIDKHSQKLIVTTIQLLLDYCTRFYDRQFYIRSNYNKDIVTRFEQLIKNYFTTSQPQENGLPTVRYCGEQLNMSANYLSDLLKKETGRNTQEHIHFFIIEKAKTELLGTNNPISSIAYNLGFEYPQHFSKIFKNKTGMTPAEYRNSITM